MIRGQLTISRIHSNTEPDYIEIRFCDDDAAIEFATAKLSLADFAAAVTGLARVDCEIETRGLEHVGKKMETDTIEFQMPKGNCNDRKEVARDIVDRYCPMGWVPDRYFGSQGSFFDRDGRLWARTTIRRWVANE